jgi:hypothetical protein
VRGESYKVDAYERVIGRAFEHVAMSARLKTDTVAQATRPDPEGADELALARIKREREQAALRFAKERDLGKLEATMARLDAEAAAAVVRPSMIPTAAEARLPRVAAGPLGQDLGCRAARDRGGRVRADRCVPGANDFTFALTVQARARGWDAPFGPGVVRVKEGQSGRGERI